MKKTTFDAAVAVLIQRWPFPDGAEEAFQEWKGRLWLATGDWKEPRITGFKKAVDAYVSQTRQFGRPSPESIIELSLARSGLGGRTGNEVDHDWLAKDRARCNAEWNAYNERRRADPVQRAAAVAKFMRGMLLWPPNRSNRRYIVGWLRDFWGVPMDAAEHARLCAMPQRRPAKDTPRGLQGEPVRMFPREPGEDDGPLEPLGGVGGAR